MGMALSQKSSAARQTPMCGLLPILPCTLSCLSDVLNRAKGGAGCCLNNFEGALPGQGGGAAWKTGYFSNAPWCPIYLKHLPPLVPSQMDLSAGACAGLNRAVPWPLHS